jgi:hypothetical protein
VDPAFISHQGQEKFFVGINLGNVNLFPFHKAPYRFASVEDATSEAPGSLQREAVQAMLRQEFAKMAANGINAVRVWLHIDGGQNPVFDEQGLVSDISQPFLEDLKFLIRTADANGIALNLTLWSHDILAVRILNSTDNRTRAIRLIEDPTATQAYIDHALVPMIRSLDECMSQCNSDTPRRYHDNVLAWEVLNEPEGVSRDWRLYLNYQYNLEFGSYYYKNPAHYDSQPQRQIDYRSARYLQNPEVDAWGLRLGGGYLHSCDQADRCAEDPYAKGRVDLAKYEGYHFVADQGWFNDYMYHDVTNKYNSEFQFLKRSILRDESPLQTRSIDKNAVLRFINRIAGAIHRHQPDAKVSVGSHSMAYNSDIPALKGTISRFEPRPENYYSDTRLRLAFADTADSPDPLGYLDFYQTHGYPDWEDRSDHITRQISPFFHPKSHWQLDKPLVVGEFWNLITASHQKLTTEDLQRLKDQGYAGAWGWAYFEVREDRLTPANRNIPVQRKRTVAPHELQDEFLRLIRQLQKN